MLLKATKVFSFDYSGPLLNHGYKDSNIIFCYLKKLYSVELRFSLHKSQKRKMLEEELSIEKDFRFIGYIVLFFIYRDLLRCYIRHIFF